MIPENSNPVEASILIQDLHFPECLRWHDSELFFCDMYGNTLHAYDPSNGELRTVAEIAHPGGIGWLPDGRMLAVASEDRQILEIGKDTNHVYADLSDLVPGWLNDMYVDDDGSIYVGNFGYDLFSEEPRVTQLAVVDIYGEITMQSDDVLFPNGIVKRSDGKLVVAETFAKCLTTFVIEAGGNLRYESRLPVGEAFPDGICIDDEDQIWISSVFDKAVIRVSQGGEMDSRAVSQMAFSCVLGGADGRTLFVATAPDFEPANRRVARSGKIETIRVEVPSKYT